MKRQLIQSEIEISILGAAYCEFVRLLEICVPTIIRLLIDIIYKITVFAFWWCEAQWIWEICGSRRPACMLSC